MSTKWPLVKAKYLLTRQSHPADEVDGTVTAFRDGEVVLRSHRRTEGFTEAEKYIGYQGVKPGELVIHSMDAFAGAIGISKSKGKMSPVVHIYRAVHEVDLRFYSYYLRHLAKSGYIQSLSKGIRERSTAFDPPMLSQLELPKPPIEVQQKIADFLDAECTYIEQIVEKKLDLARLLEEQLQDAISEILESVAGQVKLKYRFSSASGNSISAEFIAINNLERASGIPFIATKEIGSDRIINYDTEIRIPPELTDSFRIASPGAIFLCSEGGSAGKKFALNHSTVTYGNKLFALTSKKNMTEKLLFYIFLSRNFQSQFKLGMNGMIGGVSSGVLGEILIPDVSPEQERILLETLELIYRTSQEAIKKVEYSVDLLFEYRFSIITSAVTGELDLERHGHI